MKTYYNWSICGKDVDKCLVAHILWFTVYTLTHRSKEAKLTVNMKKSSINIAPNGRIPASAVLKYIQTNTTQ